MGNAASKEEFFEHYAYLIRELYRVTVPGRCCAVHVKDLPLFINRDGEMGIDPFSDDVTAAFRRNGWVLQSRVTIEKDPVIEMRKTNSHGLLFKPTGNSTQRSCGLACRIICWSSRSLAMKSR
jgi:hypothetical protein